MGNKESGNSPHKLTGRLSEDEAVALLNAFHFRPSHHHHHHGFHRSRSEFISDVTVLEFLQNFPSVVQPFLAALLPELRKKGKRKKTGGRMTADYLIEIGSVFVYPRPYEIETLIIRSLSRKQESDKDQPTDQTIINQFLTFVYLLSLHLQHPKSLLFSMKPSEIVSKKLLEASSPDLPHFPQYKASECHSSTTFSNEPRRLDSWDLVNVFKTAGAPDPRNITFPSLEASFLEFRSNHATDPLEHVVCKWIDINLKFLPLTISLGLKGMLNPKSKKGMGSSFDQLHLPLDEDDDSDGLPLHSDSMIGQQQLTGGWKGFYLASSSRCFDDELCFAIRQSNPDFHANRWTRLYASWIHGRSFNRFTTRIINYPAISIVVVRTDQGEVFGACVGSPWQESNGKYFGTVDTFLWTFKPRFSLIRSSGSGTNFVYLNTKNTFSPKGIGFGGQTTCFRLWLDDEFRDCYCCTSDNTYLPGPLCLCNSHHNSYQTKFNIQEVEVWGTGDASALQRQSNQHSRDENIRMERRQVDRSRFMENEFDKEFLLGDKFSGSKNER